MGKFAAKTDVSIDRSLDEIRRTLKRYGAKTVATIDREDKLMIGFEMRDRSLRFVLPLPAADDDEFEITTGNQYSRRGTGEYSQAKYEQAVRQRHRALLLTIKAKLESVESGIETFDEAFMGQLVLPDGQTMQEWASPQLEQLFLDGKMPPLLGRGN